MTPMMSPPGFMQVEVNGQLFCGMAPPIMEGGHAQILLSQGECHRSVTGADGTFHEAPWTGPTWQSGLTGEQQFLYATFGVLVGLILVALIDRLSRKL